MLKKIASYIIVLGIGGVLGSFLGNFHTIEEKIVYKDRTRTVVKEVITVRPDGTKVTTRVSDKQEKVDQVAKKSESIPVKKDWGVGVKYDLGAPVPVWTIEVQRRVIGNFYAGAYGRTDGVVGVGVTLLF